MPRAAIASLALMTFMPSAAPAEIIRIEPAPCPIPADIAPLVSDDVGAYELNSAGDLDDLFLYQDVAVGDGALTLRVFPDPETGRVDGLPRTPRECPVAPEKTE